jgi:hypothetical protein
MLYSPFRGKINSHGCLKNKGTNGKFGEHQRESGFSAGGFSFPDTLSGQGEAGF